MAEEVMYQTDMSQVPAPGDMPEPGVYQVRISKVDTHDQNGAQLLSKTSGKPVVKLSLKVQTEGPMMGRVISDTPSLESTALFKLKGYYAAVGYNPGQEGHNPHKLLDGECWILVEASTYQGKASYNIPPWSIKSSREGPVRVK